MTLGLVSCAALPGEFQGSLAASVPRHIDQGRAFGVAIGTERLAARATLLRIANAHFVGEERCRDYPASHETCDGATETDVFRVDGVLATGLIYLYIQEGRVVRILWSARQNTLNG